MIDKLNKVKRDRNEQDHVENSSEGSNATPQESRPNKRGPVRGRSYAGVTRTNRMKWMPKESVKEKVKQIWVPKVIRKSRVIEKNTTLTSKELIILTQKKQNNIQNPNLKEVTLFNWVNSNFISTNILIGKITITMSLPKAITTLNLSNCYFIMSKTQVARAKEWLSTSMLTVNTRS
jgi:hypothetical protein